MPFIDDENSEYGSSPSLGVVITAGLLTLRLTNQPVSLSLGGNTHTAAANLTHRRVIRREIAATGNEVEVIVARSALPSISPVNLPRPFNIVVTRYQPSGSGLVFDGKITNVKVENENLVLLCIPDTQLRMARRAPGLVVIPQCARVLYDEWCREPRASHTFTADVVSVSGLAITLNGVGGQADGYFAGGEFIHDGVKRTVTTHVGMVLTVDFPFPTTPGGTVTFHPGCDKAVGTCTDKFNNFDNFLGAPHRPDENVHILGINGLRVTVS